MPASSRSSIILKAIIDVDCQRAESVVNSAYLRAESDFDTMQFPCGVRFRHPQFPCGVWLRHPQFPCGVRFRHQQFPRGVRFRRQKFPCGVPCRWGTAPSAPGSSPPTRNSRRSAAHRFDAVDPCAESPDVGIDFSMPRLDHRSKRDGRADNRSDGHNGRADYSTCLTIPLHFETSIPTDILQANQRIATSGQCTGPLLHDMRSMICAGNRSRVSAETSGSCESCVSAETLLRGSGSGADSRGGSHRRVSRPTGLRTNTRPASRSVPSGRPTRSTSIWTSRPWPFRCRVEGPPWPFRRRPLPARS